MFNDETMETRFTLALRGYDRDEVEVHLSSLQEQLEAAEATLIQAEEGRDELSEKLAASNREAADLRAALHAGPHQGEEVAEARGRIAELQLRLDQQEAGAAPRAPNLDDIGHNIAAVLRSAQEQADRIREAATSAAESIRSGAEHEATEVRNAAEVTAAEMRRAAADEVTTIFTEAQSKADVQLEEACAEADRLTASAAAEQATAHQLRAKAEHDRELSASALAGARDEADRIIEAAYGEALRRVEALSGEREQLLEQLRTLAFSLNGILASETEEHDVENDGDDGAAGNPAS